MRLFPTETDGNLHSKLPRRLAHPGPVRGRATISQILLPQPLRMPRTQGQYCQQCAVPQPTDIVPENSYRLSPNEGGSHARMCTGHSAAGSLIQSLTPSPSQGISEDAGPHGLCVSRTSVGPASHAAPSVLAETASFIPHLQQGRGRPLRLRMQLSLPNLLF